MFVHKGENTENISYAVFFFLKTHLQHKNVFNENLSACLHFEVELTVYCLFCSIFRLVHFVSLARDISHLEKASCTVVK